jgi:hypothetical protein
MPGLVPGIHAFTIGKKTWMAGTSPAMTQGGFAVQPRRDEECILRAPYQPPAGWVEHFAKPVAIVHNMITTSKIAGGITDLLDRELTGTHSPGLGCPEKNRLKRPAAAEWRF